LILNVLPVLTHGFSLDCADEVPVSFSASALTGKGIIENATQRLTPIAIILFEILLFIRIPLLPYSCLCLMIRFVSLFIPFYNTAHTVNQQSFLLKSALLFNVS